MKHKGRRLFAILMTVLMVVGILPTDFALTRADAATTFGDGKPVQGGNWDG